MSDFNTRLTALCVEEMTEAHGDDDRMAAAFEALARALGVTIAVAALGDPQRVEQFAIGAEGYVLSTAVDRANTIRGEAAA